MMGIQPSFQRQNIGYQLKLAQRQAVQQQGIDLITWTYDPLETGNARLNMHKLGAQCHTYIPNLYGEIEGINAGLPSDRFQVEWHINSTHVENRLAKDGISETAVPDHLILNPAGKNGRPPETTSPPSEARHFAQIPGNFQAIKASDIQLAFAWRLHARQLFTELFAQNYTVTDFIFQQGNAYYKLDIVNESKEATIGRFSKLHGNATVNISTEAIMEMTRSNK